ncbi:MAG: ABC transporter transmembrane domain-containing protein, partial [Hyphomicrobiaceae bacterium]
MLRLLWPERWLSVALIIGNIGIAGIGFLEPILFGRVIDVLATSAERSAEANWLETVRLLGIWSLVGLVGIVSGILVALHADRLAHRRRLAAVALYFEHVLSLPAAFHQREHSGRMLKVMLTGSYSLFGLWLSFFREHLSTFVAVLVLPPIALYMNWKMALLLIALLVVFTMVNYLVINRTWRAQATVEDYNSELAARAGDALSNVMLVQSFVRLALETREMGAVIQRLLAAQFPVLNLWALVTVFSRMASTITVIGIFVLGSYLYFQGEISVGEIVSFMGFATMLIGRLEQATGFIGNLFFQVPGLSDYFAILDTEPGVRDKPHAAKLG